MAPIKVLKKNCFSPSHQRPGEKCGLKTVLAVLLANPILCAAVDLNHQATLHQFVAKVAENERKNRLREMNYLYRLQRDRIILDGRGREKKRTSSTYEVNPPGRRRLPEADRQERPAALREGSSKAAEEGRGSTAPPEGPFPLGPGPLGAQAFRAARQGRPFFGRKRSGPFIFTIGEKKC